MHSGARFEIALGELPVGFTLSQPVHDHAGVLLLAANHTVTADQLQQLHHRGIATLSLHAHDRRRILSSQAPGPNQTKPLAVSAVDQLWTSETPIRGKLADRYGESPCPKRQKRIDSLLTKAISDLVVIGKSLRVDSNSAKLSLTELFESLAAVLIEDPDQTIGSLLSASEARELSARIVQLAALSMAMSIELKMPASATMEIGLAAMLHDVSLFRMSPRLRSPVSYLSPEERWEYESHPLESQEMLVSLDIPHAVKLTVAQVHEQLDGSGFPRQLTEARIHPYAKVINAADAYLRIIGPGPGRPPIGAHDAIGVILHTQRRRLFEPYILRALISVLTLFPLGSTVQLSDGRIGQVVRRPRKGFDAPTVRIDSASTSEPRLVMLDSSNLKIASPQRSRVDEQLRIPREVLRRTVWHPSNY